MDLPNEERSTAKKVKLDTNATGAKVQSPVPHLHYHLHATMEPEVLSVLIPAKLIVQKGETAVRRNPEASDRRPHKMGPRGFIALREIGKMDGQKI
jgi:hypothetical protein